MPATDIEDRRSRARGCLLGLAVGDALGAPVEFLSLEEIRERFGPEGLRDLHPWDGFPAGTYTDDTQMSIATLEGVLEARARSGPDDLLAAVDAVYERYLAWLATQERREERRRPGRTCITALESGIRGTVERRINNSKGCGGVMRTAPIGLTHPPEAAFRLGAECAALTHGHPSGYLSAGYLSEAIAHLAAGRDLPSALRLPLEMLADHEGGDELRAIMEEAFDAVGTEQGRDLPVARVGLGWVGEEALAIASFCGMRSPTDWSCAVLAAANHAGDSDSTGSICGAMLGAALGADAIPSSWVARVENREGLERLAEALVG